MLIYKTARHEGLPPALAQLAVDGVPVSSRGDAVGLGLVGDPTMRIEVDGETIVAVRGLDPRPGPPGWLTWLRLGLSERLLDLATAYLSGRDLLRHQLVQATIAEIVTAHLEVRAAPEHLAVQHTITRADRSALRLLGASGFLAGGPGQTAYVSELLADVYLER